MGCPESTDCFLNFTVWDPYLYSFSVCFETFIFVVGPFALLAIASAFYIGKLRPPDVSLRLPYSFKLRKMSVGITIFLTLGALLNDLILFKQVICTVMLLSYGARILSLTIHFIFLWRLGLIHFDYKRGPVFATLSWFLTFPFYVVRLERMIEELMQNSKPNVEINEAINMVCVAGMVACQLVYIIGIVRGNPRYRTVSILTRHSDSTANLMSINSGSDRYCDVDAADFSETESEQPCPVDSAWKISKLLFCWVQSLMKKGSKRLLQTESSVYQLPSDINTSMLCHKFNEKLSGIIFKAEMQRVQSPNSKPKRNLLKTLHSMFGVKYYLLGFLKFGADALGFAGPIFLNLLVTFVEQKEPIYKGCIYAAALFGSTLIGSLLSTHFDYQVRKLGIAMKSSLIGTVYTKTMKSKPVSLASYSTGEITNFMSTDVNRVVNFCPSFHQFWSLPFQVITTLVLLYYQIGIVFLAGLGLTLLMILFNRYLAIKIGQYNRGLMEHKDGRVNLMTEILLGIRVVKFNVWEEHLTEEINSIRTKELKSLRGIKYFDALCVYLWATTPVLISLLIFSIYVATGNFLTAAKVFTVVALINMLISPLNAFPWVLNGLMEAWVSLDRLEEFANLPDFDMEKYYDAYISTSQNHYVLKIEDGVFSWNKQSPGESDAREPQDYVPVVENGKASLLCKEADTAVATDEKNKDLQLQGISMQIHPGQFVGVIGTVGSGKSSLLSAICAEMEKLKGSISLCDAQEGVALVSQEPWIQHATVKENILWGQSYKQELYEATVECCALNEDFNILPHGDLTEVGENGVTLSGGQKARVALARAVYQNKSLYLMDDPLSAVDQHVAAHLYHQCITGILRDRTRVLCTHHTKYLRHADLIVEMEEGKIKSIGAPSDILKFEDSSDEVTLTAAKNIQRADEGETTKVENLMSKEEKAVGTVDLKVYKAYWLAVGGCLAFTILLFVVLMQGSKVASDWWLSHWVTMTSKNSSQLFSCTGDPMCLTNHTRHVVGRPLILTDISYTVLLSDGGIQQETADDKTWRFYLMIYGIIAAGNSICTLIRAFSFAYGGICAAKTIHQNLLEAIMKAPISFFDVTPIGRIINRFSSDMYTIDDSLPFMLNIFLAQLAGLIATVAVTCYGLPYFAILLIPLSIYYYFTQRYYRHTSRDLKRLSSISLSPIYAHFTESLMGISTIRAYRKTDMFRERNIELIDANQRCNFSTLAAQQWLAIRLQMMGVVMVTGVAFTAVLERQFGSESTVTAGMVGLALSYALSVTSRLSGVISSFTETEKQMVAVERQSYYIGNVPQERLKPVHELQLREAWPSGGAIEFRHVSLRYRPNLPMALNNVVFNIEPGEKVGIAGRTGSGKSSLFLTLFGMVPVSSGTILIDCVSIAKVPLRTFRSKMAIIPQDPFLFNGTIRTNLDPTLGEDKSHDNALWWALESCGLRKVVENMGGLDAETGERGKRFSVGQRQLFCLARALLKDVQIICLDEATANVDRKSDSLLQDTIRRQFSRRTVLTIAHRIETITDCDRVLVMSDGQVAEFDRPQKLLENPESLFARLVQQSNAAGKVVSG